MSDAIDKNEIQPSRLEHHSGASAATLEWLSINYKNIPPGIRPDRKELGRFSAFFGTYLTSSFQVAEGPGTRRSGGCQCEACLTIINLPHLRTKKLYARDKRRADYLMVESLTEFADQKQTPIAERDALRFVASKTLRRSVAFITYGDWLIRRLDGESDGPAILALWRIIAWDPRGGVRPGFKLKLDDFRMAEETLVLAIKNAK